MMETIQKGYTNHPDESRDQTHVEHYHGLHYLQIYVLLKLFFFRSRTFGFYVTFLELTLYFLLFLN